MVWKLLNNQKVYIMPCRTKHPRPATLPMLLDVWRGWSHLGDLRETKELGAGVAGPLDPLVPFGAKKSQGDGVLPLDWIMKPSETETHIVVWCTSSILGEKRKHRRKAFMKITRIGDWNELKTANGCGSAVLVTYWKSDLSIGQSHCLEKAKQGLEP